MARQIFKIYLVELGSIPIADSNPLTNRLQIG